MQCFVFFLGFCVIFIPQFWVTWSLCGDMHVIVHLIVLYCDVLYLFVMPQTHRDHFVFTHFIFSIVTFFWIDSCSGNKFYPVFFCKMLFNKWQGINKRCNVSISYVGSKCNWPWSWLVWADLTFIKRCAVPISWSSQARRGGHLAPVSHDRVLL